MDEIDQSVRDDHELTARNIEAGAATDDDMARVLAILAETGRRRHPERHPRLNSADDFETWVVRPGYDGLNLIHLDETAMQYVVGWSEDGYQGRAQASGIGAAMWASFVRAARCRDTGEETRRDPNAPRVYVVSHRYAIEGSSLAVEVPSGFDAARTVAYMQLACEEWHASDSTLLPQTVVEAMIRFYGCSPAPMPEYVRYDDEIDLYIERERFCTECKALMLDDTLARAELHDFLSERYC